MPSQNQSSQDNSDERNLPQDNAPQKELKTGRLSPVYKDRIAWLFVLICPAFFASNMVIARAMVGLFPPISMAFMRWFLVGLVVFCVLLAYRKVPWSILRAEYKSILWLASLGMGLCGGPVYMAGELTSATNIGLIYSAAPLCIALLAFLRFGEPLRLVQVIGLMMGLIGVLWIIIRGDFTMLAQLSFNGGDLLILMAMASFSIYSLGLKYSSSALSQFQRFGAMALGGALWHLPFILWEIAERGPWPEWNMTIISALLMLVFSASLGAYLSYGFIVSRLGATIAGSTLYLSPIYTAVMAVMFLGEVIEPYHIISAGFILSGLWLVSRKKAQPYR